MTSNAPLDASRLTGLYRSMLRIRRFEEAVADFVEAGEVRTPCHLCIGQEAAATGVCEALETGDMIWGAHRSHGHYLAKGGDMNALMAEIFCRTTGCSRGRGGSMHICQPAAGIMGTVPIVAATIPIAVGAGLAVAMKGEPHVSVAFFGDGATEEGHFHESVNLAALRRLPVLFICENNLYSSHMGLFERRAVDRLTEFAEAHGIPGIRIDGNDILAVLQSATEAVARARTGKGPTFIECRTFRWRGHVGHRWDEDVGVKRKDELKEWLDRDPVALCGELCRQRGIAQSALDEIERQVVSEIESSVEFAKSSPQPGAEELGNHVYSVAG